MSYRSRVRRLLALLIIVLGLAPGTWWREQVLGQSLALKMQVVPLAVPPRAEYSPHLGPFRLAGIWQITSPRRVFGGFSALLPPRNGRILAFSDKGWHLEFSLPGSRFREPKFERIYKSRGMWPYFNDVEAVARDPATGELWLSSEGRNAIARLGPDLRLDKLVLPAAMQAWGTNSAAEAMTRLPDGRFVLLREAFTSWFEDREHEALIFDGDPVEGIKPQHFTMKGPANFSPTEMARLPDGRYLVLMRRPLWPLPARFAGRIAIGDPGLIRVGKTWQLLEVAKLTSTLLVDNFEGMAIEPRKDGKVNVWLISDDNSSAIQRTLLWKLVVDPADLPGGRAGGVGESTRQSENSK